MTTPRSYAPLLLPLLLGCAAVAQAQHSPLIERMADTPASPAAAPAPVPASVPVVAAGHVPARPEIGDTTRALLRMQADGSRAGNALPMLGEAASRSYQRYLNSFDHPIPEFFEATLPTSEQGSSR